MVADTTRLDDSHAPCAETTLRVRPGRSAGLSSDLVAFLCPAPMAGLFFCWCPVREIRETDSLFVLMPRPASARRDEGPHWGMCDPAESQPNAARSGMPRLGTFRVFLGQDTRMAVEM